MTKKKNLFLMLWRKAVSGFPHRQGKKIESIKTAAGNTLKKNRRITICLYDHDYIGIQKKAVEMGIPCQTLISGIIHRYVESEIK